MAMKPGVSPQCGKQQRQADQRLLAAIEEQSATMRELAGRTASAGRA